MALGNPNGEFHEIFLRKGFVGGIVLPPFTQPAFTLPLVHSYSRANTVYIQNVGWTGRVTGFDPFETSGLQVEPVPSYPIEVDGEEVYALLDPSGEPRVGTKRELSPDMRRWAGSVDAPISQMKFARFCGKHDLASTAAHHAVLLKAKELDDDIQARKWFIISAIAGDLLEMLGPHSATRRSKVLDLQHATDIGVDQISQTRMRVTFTRKSETTHQAGKNLYRKRLTNVLKIAKAATGMDIDIAERDPRDLYEGDAGHSPNRHRMVPLAGIADLPRWEARIAAFLIHSIYSPSETARELDHYEDASSHGQKALERLRRSNVLNALSVDQAAEEISTLVPNLVSESYPLRRGRLLLELAITLGEFEVVSNSIMSTLKMYHSSSVDEVRSPIITLLSRRNI